MSDSIQDSTNDHQGPPAKGIPLPRPRKVLVDENDLWNLDEDFEAIEETENEDAALPFSARIPQKQNSDYITRIEPIPSAPRAPYEPIDEPEPELPAEEETGFIPLLETVQETAPMVAKKPLPFSPAEDDIWSDFDDEDAEMIATQAEQSLPEMQHTFEPDSPVDNSPLPQASESTWSEPFPEVAAPHEAVTEQAEEPRPYPSYYYATATEELPAATESYDEPAYYATATESYDDQQLAPPIGEEVSDITSAENVPELSSIPALPSPIEEAERVEDEEEHEETLEQDDPNASDSPPIDLFSLAGPSWQSMSKFEITAILASLGVLVFLAVATLIVFRTDIRTEKNPYLRASMPARGEMATIDSYQSYWRKPIREGPQADAARLDIISIPELELTLGACSASSGVIRVIFYNDAGEMAGDTLTFRHENGKFLKTSSETITIPATTGFRSFGEQEAYRARQTQPWTIRVYEGDDENSPSSSFRLLFSSAISTNRQ